MAIDNKVNEDFLVNLRRFEQVVWGRVVTRNGGEGISDVTFAASTYYAAELLQAIRRRMPDATVILEPTVLRANDSGEIVEAPQIASDLPADVIIDIVDPQYPERPFMGTMFSYTLRVAPATSQGNCGLLLGMEEEIKHASMPRASENCASIYADDAPNPRWFLGFSEKEVSVIAVPLASQLPLRKNATVAFPPVNTIDAGMFGATQPEYVKTSRPKTAKDVSTMTLHPHIENLANIVATVPSLVPASQHAALETLPYIRTFDPKLADSIQRGAPLDSKQADNVQIIKKLLATELNIRSKRDIQLSAWILGGDYGKSFRRVRDQSFDSFNSMMKAAWVSALMVTAAAPATSSPWGALSQNMTMLQQHASNMDVVGQGITERFIPSLDVMDAEFVDFGGKRVAIYKGDQQALRKSLKDLYAQNKR
ncbi:hypothetical protein [Paraburkholderia sediminicola]|uniref:hypothetical protein n=1 Tax=Paraburkholderia sediminicola TaxID=458836 RepID=UPI0038BD8B00